MLPSCKNIITPELKKAGNKTGMALSIAKDQYDLPDYDRHHGCSMRSFTMICKAGKIVSAYALDGHGIAAAVSKMAFGNAMGVKIEHSLDTRDFFAPGFGDLVLEVPAGKGW